jgi:hypothetical protein
MDNNVQKIIKFFRKGNALLREFLRIRTKISESYFNFLESMENLTDQYLSNLFRLKEEYEEAISEKELLQDIPRSKHNVERRIQKEKLSDAKYLVRISKANLKKELFEEVKEKGNLWFIDKSMKILKDYDKIYNLYNEWCEQAWEIDSISMNVFILYLSNPAIKSYFRKKSGLAVDEVEIREKRDFYREKFRQYRESVEQIKY